MRSSAIALILLGLLSAGCTAPSDGEARRNAAGNNGRIVCTTAMVSDIVRQVVGDRYEVIGLMGEGVDPHLYKPTTRDTARLRDAAVIFYNGLMLEGPMQQPLRTLARSQPVFAVTAGIPADRLRTSSDYEGHPDPHVWMDVSLWSLAVDEVAARMSEIDPDFAETYRASAADYKQKLQALDEYVRTVIASIPEPQRYLVTAHDAFAYFSRAYDIPVESVQGITTESEPGVKDIIRLVDLLVEQQIPALFVESSVNQDNLRAVIEGARKRGWEVRQGGTLYSDAMGPAGTYTGTYIGMIDHNATTIARALGGEAPAGGLNGRLSGRLSGQESPQ
jgi:manganese/zinc/iron transport system substrate-binding protein